VEGAARAALEQAPLDVIEPIQIAAGLVAAGLLLVWTIPSLARALSFIGL
jgi:hypothetical protein